MQEWAGGKGLEMDVSGYVSMTDKEIRAAGYQFGRGVWMALWTVAALFMLAVLAFILIAGLFGFPARDSTDSPTERSGMALRVDHGTGCQYLETSEGGITPRLDAAGKQVCNP